MLALVFGSAAAQELTLTGTVEVSTDLLSVTSSDWDKDQVGRKAPDSYWSSLAENITWTWSEITFKAVADGVAGMEFQLRAPDVSQIVAASTSLRIGNIEAWVQPFGDIFRITAGNKTWREVERYKDYVDDFQIAYGINGVTKIDEFKEGLKLDVLPMGSDGLKITLLAGANYPAFLATGKESKGAGMFNEDIDMSLSSPTDIDDVWTQIATAMAAGGMPMSVSELKNLFDIVEFDTPTGTSGTFSPTATSVTLRIKAGLLSQVGFDGVSPFGQFVTGYGARVVFPLEGVGKFYAMYRIKATPKVAILDGTAADPEYEGYYVTTNEFGIFADLSGLFDGMGLPLKLVAGYTGSLTSGKIAEKKILPGNISATNTGKQIDGDPVFISGIDLRVQYDIIPEALTVVLHNNFVLATLKYDSVYGYGKNVGASFKPDDYSGPNKADFNYFRMFNALGANYQLNDTVGLNLEVANDLTALGNYLKPGALSTGKDKGDAAYKDTFSVQLNLNSSLTPKVTTSIGVKFSSTSTTSLSQKTNSLGVPVEKRDGVAAVSTVSTFSIPTTITVKF